MSSRRQALAHERRGGGRRRAAPEVYGFSDGSRPRRPRRWPWIVIPLLLVVALIGGAATVVYSMFPEQIQALIGVQEETDYEGAGEGDEVLVTIASGDIGSDIAATLADSGVTMTRSAFYDLLVSTVPEPTFTPGTYRLSSRMSAASALAALQDPANRISNTVLVREGEALPAVLDSLATTLAVPLADVQAAAADVASFGLPAEATTVEGFLFPATYEFTPGTAPRDALQRMVDRSNEVVAELGIPAEARWRTVVLASIVQRESGPSVEDMGMIARVFQNRLDRGMNLESDATVAYGTGNTDTVWTTDSERADAGNLYNTYANPGLPVGPVGNPGADALRSALSPTPGDWLYFVPIDLSTGETVFSTTYDDHLAAVEQLRAWCRASDENRSYCA